ncbi:MAG TPA: Calx-beta domain-containing protein [Thermoanaerobaculia bacterium]|jgi:hypothetical protein
MKWLALTLLLSSPELSRDINTNPETARPVLSEYRLIGDDAWISTAPQRLVWRVTVSDGVVHESRRAHSIGRAGNTPLFLTGRPDGTSELSTPDRVLRTFGPAYSDPTFLAEVNGLALFNAEGKLYATDGTPEGTRVLSEIPAWLRTVAVEGNTAFFLGSNSIIYRTDGIDVVPAYDRPLSLGSMAVSQGKIFISSDGVEVIEGGVRRTLYRYRSSSEGPLVPAGGGIIFQAGTTVWWTDGRIIRPLIELVRAKLSAEASDGTFAWLTIGDELFRTDGREVQRVATVPQPSLGRVEGGRLLLTSGDGNSAQPWISDGTTTRQLATLPIVGNGNASPQSIVPCGNAVCFLATGNDKRQTLWRSDGTPEGTYELFNGTAQDIRGGGPFAWFTAGSALWRTDGTPEGTRAVFDGMVVPHVALPDGRLLFSRSYEWWVIGNGAPTGVALRSGLIGAQLLGSRVITHGGELVSWTSDLRLRKTIVRDDYRSYAVVDGIIWVSTANGMVRNDSAGSSPVLVERITEPFSLLAAGDRLFLLSEGALRTLGGEWIETPRRFSVATAGDRLVFFTQAEGGTPDGGTSDLWASDGTTQGTRLLRPGGGHFLGQVEDTAFFSTGDELWMTDGTAAGTRLVATLGDPGPITVAGGRAYFAATTPETGRELWSFAIEPQPRLAVEEAWTFEDSGRGRIAVTLDAPANRTVTVAYDVIAGTATEADFTPATGTLTFAPGEVRKDIDVIVVNDAEDEGTETVRVVLRDEAGADVRRSGGVLLIEERPRTAFELALAGVERDAVLIEIISRSNHEAILSLEGDFVSCTSSKFAPAGFRETVRCSRGGFYASRDSTVLRLRSLTAEKFDEDPIVDTLAVAWPSSGTYAMAANSHTFAPGEPVVLSFAAQQSPTPTRFILQSSDRSVLDVPMTAEIAAGTATIFLPPVRARRTGVVTIVATPVGRPQTRITLQLQVVAPGAAPREGSYSSFPRAVWGQVRGKTAPVSVEVRSPTRVTPTGVVEFRIGDFVFDRVPVVNGVATGTLPASVSTPTYTVTATYLGDARHLPSSATTTVSLLDPER